MKLITLCLSVFCSTKVTVSLLQGILGQKKRRKLLLIPFSLITFYFCLKHNKTYTSVHISLRFFKQCTWTTAITFHSSGKDKYFIFLGFSWKTRAFRGIYSSPADQCDNIDNWGDSMWQTYTPWSWCVIQVDLKVSLSKMQWMNLFVLLDLMPFQQYFSSYNTLAVILTRFLIAIEHHNQH